MKGTPVALALVVLVSAVAGGTSVAADNEAPLVDAGLDQTVTEGQTVLLDGGGSRDPDGEIVSYRWTITTPDNSTTTPKHPSRVRTEFVASQPGTYEVTLAVTDDDGATRTDTLYVTVEADDGGDPASPEGPSVQLAGDTSAEVGQRTQHLAALAAGDAPLERVVWRVDGAVVERASVDGQTADATFGWTFGTAGTHRVTVTAVDAAGRNATDRTTVTVEEPSTPEPPAEPPGSGSSSDGTASTGDEEPPTVTIRGPDNVTIGTTGKFVAEASDPDGVVQHYRWQNVDATSLDSTTAWRIFREPGTYEIAVTVEDNDGNTATATKTVDVESGLDVELKGPDTVPTEEEASFTAEVSNPYGNRVSYSWSPADGNADGDRYERRFDELPGEQVVVEVTVENEYGITASDSKRVQVTETLVEQAEKESFRPGNTKITVYDVRDDKPDDILSPGTLEAKSREDKFRFELEFTHEGGEDVTVLWEWSDGYTETTTKDSVNGTVTSSMTRQFVDQKGGERPVELKVTLIDESGDEATLTKTYGVSYLDTDYTIQVYPSSTEIQEGESVTLNIDATTAFTVDFADGSELERVDADSARNEITHTYDEPGIYTIQITSVGAYASTTVTIHVKRTTYSLYRYEVKNPNIENTTDKVRPGPDWERDGISHKELEPTGDVITRPRGQRPSGHYQKVGTTTITRSYTRTKVARAAPGPEWRKVEDEVRNRTEVRRVPSPYGGYITREIEVEYHRYEKTRTVTLVRVEWERYEQVTHYNWVLDKSTTEERTSLTPPHSDLYINGTLEREVYSCANKHAPKRDVACSINDR